jgi:tRNA threonylcarbamoyladenosine biosynthesis protein TsaB
MVNERPILIAIDTSTEQASVAAGDGARVAEFTWTAGREQTTTVLEQIDRCLGAIGGGVAQVGAVAVTTGPGMFSGLRVGMGIAKGLALGVDARLLGVPTLAVTAAPWRGLGRPVVAVAAAGRGRLVWAWFGDNSADAAGDFRNGTPAELLAELDARGPAIVAGELPEGGDAFSGRPGVVVRPGLAGLRRGATMLDFAWPRFVAGDADDAATLEPVYLHGTRAAAGAD